MNASEALEGREANVGDVSNKIDLVMAADTKESKEINNNNYESCVDSYYIAKKGAAIIPNIDIQDNIEQDRWDCTNKYNTWEGVDLSQDKEHKQNRMLAKDFCNDRIRKDKVGNILL
jgi:hypothetical protein